MASLRDLNRDGHPFWAFVNSFEDISSGRPYQAQRPSNEAPPPPPSFAPGGQPFSGTGMPFRGPSASNEPPPIPQQRGARTPDSSDGEQGPDHEHRRRGSHGPRGHGGHGRGGHRSGWGRHGPRGGGPGCGQRGRGGPPPFGMGGPWNMNNFADMLGSFMPREGRDVSNNQDDFVPAVDVFDTEASYVVHVSLAGAKKEDTGVSWDPESSELSITGVIHRPGDEDFLKTLAVDERKVGAFQRKVRLGSRAEPAQVDMERISAKMEDGVLRIDVPKEDKDFVEVKKVDIQ